MPEIMESAKQGCYNSYYKYALYVQDDRGKHEHRKEVDFLKNPKGTSRGE